MYAYVSLLLSEKTRGFFIMLRKDQEDNSTSESIKKYKEAKLSEYNEIWTMYGSMFPKGPICKYKEEQANAAAKWWLKMLKEDAPEIVALLTDKKKEPVQLSQVQGENFIKILTDLIWLECQNPECQRGGTNLRIDYNGQNWDLVKNAMKEVNFTVKNDAVIEWGVMTVIEQNGKVTFQNGSKIGDIYNPDNQSLDILDTENYPSPRLG